LRKVSWIPRARALLPLVAPLLLLLATLACSQGTNPVVYVTATAASVPSSEPTLPNPFKPTPTPSGPTATPIQPTPNPTYPPTNTTTTYSVQAGDTLATIAQAYGTTVEQIIALNPGVTASSIINVGQVLTLPGRPTQTTPNFKIIPDSELVNSPSVSHFDVGAYIRFQPGFIRVYSETQFGRAMSGAEIVQFVATSTSVNPRLLLALLEYRGGWISNPVPDVALMDYPMGFQDPRFKGLFNQLFWAANTLNGAYYGWKYRGVRWLEFTDHSRLAYAPELNPGTVAVQYFLSRTVDRAVWMSQIAPSGFFTTYMSMFGDPFRNAIEPLVPPDIKQPTFQFPFQPGELWYYTGGPHGGWDASGYSGWAAVDFAPPTPPDQLVVEQGNCYISPTFATAVVGGIIARSGDGAVVIDTDMDGDERTGWTVLYLHIAFQDVPDDEVVKAGTVVQPGSRIGHPSCQGFYLSAAATHLHIARRYNGEWIPADCWACAPGVPAPPFVMSGWTIRGYPNQHYQGWMENGGQVRRAEVGRDNPDNQISW
jgi:LasA protease